MSKYLDRVRAENQNRAKTLKIKLWSTKTADRHFSLFIRQRDGKCVFPGCTETDIKRLQCSHFWSRANSATRYDPDDSDALCYKHHYGDRIRGWEYNKPGAYRDFKIKQLGEKRYEALKQRAESILPRRDAIIACMELLSAYQ